MEILDLLLFKKAKESKLIEKTIIGNPVVFNASIASPLESVCVSLSYNQEGNGDPSSNNVRLITGVSSLFCMHTKKNMAQLRGYSAQTKSYNQAGSTSNEYGTTINTISPESLVTITETNTTTDYSKNNARNGYVLFRTDNMVVDQNYDVSMKVTNITSNPLDAELTDFSITSPDGNVTSASEVTENTIIWKNIPYKDDNNYQAWELRNCGVSCTISEFMVTPANTNDGVYEAYSGTKMDVVFPPLTKNICPPPIKGVSIDGQTGAETTSVTRATTDFIPVDFSTNTNYRFSGMPNTLTMWANAYNADKVSLGRTTSSKRTKYTISASSFGEGAPQGTGDIAYVRLTFSAGSGASIDDVDSSNIQLETGNSETSYEPYCNSVFGGSLDLITGVLTITNGVIASYNGETLPSVWVSDRDVYAQGTSPTTGAQVVYELATPVTVQLTPTQVAAFVGKNTIWTNTSGNITVAY